jgi:hypothetical protein
MDTVHARGRLEMVLLEVPALRLCIQGKVLSLFSQTLPPLWAANMGGAARRIMVGGGGFGVEFQGAPTFSPAFRTSILRPVGAETAFDYEWMWLGPGPRGRILSRPRRFK